MNLRDIREKYFALSSLKELFHNTDNQTIIDFYQRNKFLSSTVMFAI